VSDHSPSSAPCPLGFDMQSKKPTISVITATYNRSNVLALAIQTVLWQTLSDWELLVIGDACTDDTEEVVRSFADPRIQFFNLPRNVGEQSGPNNEGFNHSRGAYIAYLNHDDLWLPDHLEKSLEGIRETGADLVFTLAELVGPQRSHANIRCAPPSMRFDPAHPVWASCWLLRRELIEKVGPWRFYQDSYSNPSMDWLVRASKASKKLYLVPHLTVVVIPSRSIPGSYANRESELHQLYFDRIRHELDFRERELTNLAIHSPKSIASYGGWTLLRALLSRALQKLLSPLGVNTSAVGEFLRYRRKGGRVDELRRIRGLEVLERRRKGSE